MVRNSKNMRRTAWVFKNILWLLQLLTNVNSNTALQRKELESVTFFLTAAGQFCLLSYTEGLIFQIFHHTQPTGTFPQQVSLFFGILSGFPLPMQNFQRLSCHFCAFLSNFPTHF
jgi:hypothetical protein